MKDSQYYGVRLSPRLYLKLQKAARQDERTMSDITREALKQWLARREQRKGA